MKTILKAPKGFRKLRENEILRRGDRRLFLTFNGESTSSFRTSEAGSPVKSAGMGGTRHIYIRKVK